MSRNSVLMNGVIADPTAHGERQLVDWYFDTVATGHTHLPPPCELTIVTSLDPCLMCCGAILRGGFRSAVVSFDDYAGVNCKKDYLFHTLPDNLRSQAKQSMSYFGVTGVRSPKGDDGILFFDASVSALAESRCGAAFEKSLVTTKASVSAQGAISVNSLQDPADLPSTHTIFNALRAHDPFCLQSPIGFVAPDAAKLRKYLENTIARSTSERGDSSPTNAAAFIDTFGNILLAKADRGGSFPTRSAFMELTRAYAGIRAAHGGNLQYLPHPKHLRVVSLFGPSQDAGSIMDLGAFGSTLEGLPGTQNKNPLSFIIATQDQQVLYDMVRSFPRFYTEDVGLSPTPLV